MMNVDSKCMGMEEDGTGVEVKDLSMLICC